MVFADLEAEMGFEFAGDVRIGKRGDRLFSEIVAGGTLVLRKLSGGRASELGAHRFLGSKAVNPQDIIREFGERTAQACVGRVVVAAQDTTEINFAGRESKLAGLGPAGDGKTLGFFAHPVIAVDAEDEAVLGLAGARIWTRGTERTGNDKSRAFADKESECWLEGVETAAQVLQQAAKVIVVGDRESDIYEMFAKRPSRVEVLVRSRCDRKLADGGMLYETAGGFAKAAEIEVVVASKGIGDKGRTARVEVSFGKVALARPRAVKASEADDSLVMYLLQVREINPPDAAKALLWRLLTSMPIETAEQAVTAIGYYRLRWRIEQVFRVLKRDGLALEKTQVAEASRLFNLTALALGAATRIIQLTDARDHSKRPASDVLAADQMDAADALSTSLEGKTQRQKNPHPKASLSWLAWITARLGGWNCYYKPPGPKTMADGWKRLSNILQGFQLANAIKSNV